MCGHTNCKIFILFEDIRSFKKVKDIINIQNLYLARYWLDNFDILKLHSFISFYSKIFVKAKVLLQSKKKLY